MQGYDKQAALAFILKGVRPQEHPLLAERLAELIAQAIDADMAYMHASGVLDEDGNAGDGYYEDDEAFEEIVEALAEQNSLSGEQAVKAASLVAEYMDLQQAYLESKGLVDWE